MHFGNHPHLFTPYPRARETGVQEGGSHNPKQIPCSSSVVSLTALSNTACDTLGLDDNNNLVTRSSLKLAEREPKRSDLDDSSAR